MGITEASSLSTAITSSTELSTLDTGFEQPFASEISSFEASMDKASMAATPTEGMELARSVLEPFERLNTEAAELAEFAARASEDGNGFTPGEIVSLTYKAQEFGFHSQLTSNIANRLADGIQQLFRQQG